MQGQDAVKAVAGGLYKFLLHHYAQLRAAKGFEVQAALLPANTPACQMAAIHILTAAVSRGVGGLELCGNMLQVGRWLAQHLRSMLSFKQIHARTVCRFTRILQAGSRRQLLCLDSAAHSPVCCIIALMQGVQPGVAGAFGNANVVQAAVNMFEAVSSAIACLAGTCAWHLLPAAVHLPALPLGPASP